MTDITPEQQQQVEALAGSIAAKLTTFHESLTPDEQRVLGAALRQLGTPADDAAGDTAGYSTVTLLALAATRVSLLLTGLETFPPFQPREPSP
jgi:hypothetical protein